MDAYPGGWQTVFPHGSIPATVHGAPYGLHGEAALLPWDALLIEDTPQAVEVAFRVRLRRIPFAIERRIRLVAGDAAFTLTETVANESPLPFEVNWGQHITFGPPFLEPGCRILTPDGLTMRQHPIAPGESRRAAFTGDLPWPEAPASPDAPVPVDLSVTPPVGDPSDMLYLSGFGNEAWVAIENPRRGLTARILWDGDVFPWCWVWQEFGATAGWPWHGRAYVLGLEPFAGPPPNANLGPTPGREPLAFAPMETKTLRLRAFAAHRR
jgi:hypothetical protein